MRPDSDVRQVFHLAEEGLTQTEIAARAKVGQTTVSKWLRRGENAVLSSPMRAQGSPAHCPDDCPPRRATPTRPYAYLLGQYLGDGSIAHAGRGVYRLFISCCATYPNIIGEVRDAIGAVMPANAIGSRTRSGCTDVTSYSKHWPCVFPQHGPGKKHRRPIALAPWQERIAFDLHPELLLRGLIHSDGCRVINHVRGANGCHYAYPRYMFSNRSEDIQRIFVTACERLYIESRQMKRWDISIARQDSVALMDEFIGPKS